MYPNAHIDFLDARSVGYGHDSILHCIALRVRVRRDLLDTNIGEGVCDHDGI